MFEYFKDFVVVVLFCLNLGHFLTTRYLWELQNVSARWSC